MSVVVAVELHGGEDPCQASKASQPWCAQHNVDVVADVEEEGVDLGRLCIHVEWYVACTKNCSCEQHGLPALHS
jgi:hypothetical protein